MNILYTNDRIGIVIPNNQEYAKFLQKLVRLCEVVVLVYKEVQENGEGKEASQFR